MLVSVLRSTFLVNTHTSVIRHDIPEVNDNKKLVRCPQTPSELEEAQRQEYAELKANKCKQASGS